MALLGRVLLQIRFQFGQIQASEILSNCGQFALEPTINENRIDEVVARRNNECPSSVTSLGKSARLQNICKTKRSATGEINAIGSNRVFSSSSCL